MAAAPRLSPDTSGCQLGRKCGAVIWRIPHSCVSARPVSAHCPVIAGGPLPRCIMPRSSHLIRARRRLVDSPYLRYNLTSHEPDLTRYVAGVGTVDFVTPLQLCATFFVLLVAVLFHRSGVNNITTIEINGVQYIPCLFTYINIYIFFGGLQVVVRGACRKGSFVSKNVLPLAFPIFNHAFWRIASLTLYSNKATFLHTHSFFRSSSYSSSNTSHRGQLQEEN